MDILNNLHQGENNKGESQRFIQEATLTIGRVLRQGILDEVRKSPWYSVLVDETTDVAVLSEMIIYIRYLCVQDHNPFNALKQPQRNKCFSCSFVQK